MMKAKWPFKTAGVCSGVKVTNSKAGRVPASSDVVNHHYACTCPPCMDHAFRAVKRAIDQRRGQR